MKTAYAFLIAIALIAPAAMGMGLTDDSQLPQKGVVGKPFHFQLAGRNGTPPFTYKVDSGGDFPPGLSMSEQGLILGRPTTAGKFTYWANLGDTGGRHSERKLTITIDPAPPGTSTSALEDWEKPGWKLTYFEEFTIVHMDRGRWIPNYQGDLSMPGNVTIKDGLLHVCIDRDSPPAPATNAPIPTLMRPDNKGRVSSFESQAFLMQQYGWFEVRAKMPKGPGVRSAIWMSPRIEYEKLKSAGGTRENENEAIEIDLFEQLSKDPKTANCTAHLGSDTGPGHKVDQKRVALPFDASDDFHVYALEWHDNSLIWHVDGSEVYRSDKTPHAPMFMRLSVFEDDSAGGEVTFPKEMQVDYMRWYRQENAKDERR